jgi:hypothetical protein
MKAKYNKYKYKLYNNNHHQVVFSRFAAIYVYMSLTHSWGWALLEKPPIVQLFKNFPAFNGTRRFFAVFTRALHWSLSWARLLVIFRKKLIFLRRGLVSPMPKPQLENHPLSAVRDCLFNIFAATLHIWKQRKDAPCRGACDKWASPSTRQQIKQLKITITIHEKV